MECVFMVNWSCLICGVQEQKQPGEKNLVFLAEVPGVPLGVKAGYPPGVDDGVHQISQLL